MNLKNNNISSGLKVVSSFAEGFKAPFMGIKFVKKNPELKKYCIMPVILNTIIFILLLIGLVILVSNLLGSISNFYPDRWWWKILLFLAFIIGFAICFFIVIFLFTIILEIVIAPFAEILSEKTEKILFNSEEIPGIKNRPFFKQLYMDISSIFKKLFFMLIINIKHLLWNLIPVAGPVLYYIFSIRDNLAFLGMEFFDPSIVKRMDTFKEKWGFVKNHRSLFIGAGTIQTIMILIPILKVLLTPFGVIGATITFVKIYQEENSKPTLHFSP